MIPHVVTEAARRSAVPVKEAHTLIANMWQVAIEELCAGRRVCIYPMGTLKPYLRKGRTAVLKQGRVIAKHPTAFYVRFHPSTTLTALVKRTKTP